MGYSWNRPFLTVKVGDYVKWTWNSPALISTSFKVEQVQDALSDVPIGFSSGDSTSSGWNLNFIYFKFFYCNYFYILGSYLYQFNQNGIFYYWSGYVNPQQVSFRGVVKVENGIDKQFDLNVTLDGKNATLTLNETIGIHYLF